MKLLPNILWGGILCLPLIFGGCGKNHKETAEKDVPQPEDLKAKQALQGIWTDEETETVAFYAKGDSIYYPDTTNVPVRFYIWKDTLYLIGGDTVAYPIDKRGPHIFDFHSSTGEIVKLVRSEDPNDSLYFTHKGATTLTYNEVVKKDTVVFHDGERYHCYVYVNPSRQKVYKTSYTDEGIAVENVYYDNVIHICVYKGKECLFSRDYSKKSFTELVPAEVLSQAILSNMEFSDADNEECKFDATVCIPDDASCYMISICVDYYGKATMALIEY